MGKILKRTYGLWLEKHHVNALLKVDVLNLLSSIGTRREVRCVHDWLVTAPTYEDCIDSEILHSCCGVGDSIFWV